MILNRFVASTSYLNHSLISLYLSINLEQTACNSFALCCSIVTLLISRRFGSLAHGYGFCYYGWSRRWPVHPFQNLLLHNCLQYHHPLTVHQVYYYQRHNFELILWIYLSNLLEVNQNHPHSCPQIRQEHRFCRLDLDLN